MLVNFFEIRKGQNESLTRFVQPFLVLERMGVDYLVDAVVGHAMTLGRWRRRFQEWTRRQLAKYK
jgi:hypothetical protein